MADNVRCSNCGAPLDITPETIATVCSYCGYLNWVRQDLKEDVLIVKPLDDKQLQEKIRNFAVSRRLGEVFKDINIVELTLTLVPFYFIDISAEADYSGRVLVYITKCRRTKQGERCWTETRMVHVDGVYGPYRNVIPMIARRGCDVFSAKSIAYKYLEDNPRAIPIASAELSKNVWRNILSIDLDKKSVIDIALDMHLDKLREIVVKVIKREAEGKVMMRGNGMVTGSTIIWKKITPINIKMSSSKPVLLPVYTAVYRYGGGLHRLIVCGWDGDIIAFERPMKTGERISWGLLGAIASGVLGGLAGFLYTINMFASAGLFILGSIASFYCMRRALSPIKSSIVEPRYRKVLSVEKISSVIKV
jgi:hypothetical protein